MRLRNSTQGQRRRTSRPPCPGMTRPLLRPSRLPPAAIPAACAGAAAAAAPGKLLPFSNVRNEERRRAWRASRETKLQPLPSCEACAAPSPEEVRSWAQSFDKLMRSPAGRNVFREFLRTEYSEENMLFWLACEELKAEANQHVVDEKARLIYEDYVSILSPKEVSLDSRVREGINKRMQEPSAHTFDDAQLQIYTLMHRDSYPRFLSSPVYRALLLHGPTPSSSEA
ncbi:regulator of G-protein signaling 19 isoform X1 [Loxodonta africana]|uniref:regulator of G-protein signaling 19 isoform X1 n=2 Tax=Loxodonta africana TaxID=9785 RepID=UPI000C813A5F|nr:regulator of G-protein signaling 19 isoform X1 [Loxodonta africana]XP_023396625.1 regulator of G-protein signaling 19 isoform X1 [Loxodonta africana]